MVIRLENQIVPASYSFCFMVITKAPCTESDGRLATPLHTFPSSLPSIPAHMTRAWTEEMMVAYKAAFSTLGFVSARNVLLVFVLVFLLVSHLRVDMVIPG